jgi:LruC domain-containing protein
MKTLRLALVAIVFGAFACTKVNKETPNTVDPSTVTDINQLVVPAWFNYHTSNEVSFSIQLLTNDDKPIKNVRIDIMDASPELSGTILLSGSTDNFGVFTAKTELPSYMKQVVVNSDYIGIPNDVILDLVTPATSLTLGGSMPLKIQTARGKYNTSTNMSLGKATNFSYKLGTWETVNGKPNYLLTSRDVISPSFLADINTTLPERRPVPTFNPEYLSNSVERNLKITALSDVWITFVHEGAGYRNALFYYAYNKNNPPATRNDIDSLICVFPNASYSGSGGALTSGDKVKIGRFGADTVIGFALSADGFRGSNILSGTIYFSDKNLNTNETNATKKEHSVLFYDNANKRFLFGFEDLPRSNNSSDEDFNDIMFYATSNPVTAISSNNVLPITNFVDTDNDGVADNLEDYPNDANKAYNNYYPSVNGVASVAFEDQWPSKGDYDLNDLVVDYRYNVITNANNNVVKVVGKFKPRAAGGVYKNGFAVEFPINRANVANMNGATLELLQTKAVAVLFNNSRVVFNNQFNTKPGETSQNVDTMTISFDLVNPVSLNNFGLGSYNPFIFVNEADKGRGFEIHLTGKTPTNLVNSAIFGTSSDATNLGAGVYYKTKNNLPYAINIPQSFAYPKEKIQIINAYNFFGTWATSGGTQKSDWYLNTAGYRQVPNIY